MMVQLKHPIKDILPKIELKCASKDNTSDNTVDRTKSSTTTTNTSNDTNKTASAGDAEPLSFQDMDGDDNKFELKEVGGKLIFSLSVNDESKIPLIKQLSVYAKDNGVVTVKIGGMRVEGKGKALDAVELSVPKRHGKNVSDKLVQLYTQYYAKIKNTTENTVSFQDMDGDQIDFCWDEDSNTIRVYENESCVLMSVSSLTTEMHSNGSCSVKYKGRCVNSNNISKNETTIAKRQAKDVEIKLKKFYKNSTTELYSWIDPNIARPPANECQIYEKEYNELGQIDKEYIKDFYNISKEKNGYYLTEEEMSTISGFKFIPNTNTNIKKKDFYSAREYLNFIFISNGKLKLEIEEKKNKNNIDVTMFKKYDLDKNGILDISEINKMLSILPTAELKKGILSIIMKEDISDKNTKNNKNIGFDIIQMISALTNVSKNKNILSNNSNTKGFAILNCIISEYKLKQEAIEKEKQDELKSRLKRIYAIITKWW